MVRLMYASDVIARNLWGSGPELSVSVVPGHEGVYGPIKAKASGLDILCGGSRVNKSELVDAVAGRVAVDRKTVNSAVDVLLDTVTRTVAKGERVVLAGFGSFEKVKPSRRPQPGNRDDDHQAEEDVGAAVPTRQRDHELLHA
jgi:nucleoid DNA-binding protein